MSDSKFRLAVCQIRTRADKNDTLSKAEEMVREAALHGASVVVLPEMFTSLCSHEYFHQYAEPGDGRTFQSLSRWAGEYNVILVGGSIPETENGKLYNSSFVFDRNGELLARHRKVHMFDIDLKDQLETATVSLIPISADLVLPSALTSVSRNISEVWPAGAPS